MYTCIFVVHIFILVQFFFRHPIVEKYRWYWRVEYVSSLVGLQCEIPSLDTGIKASPLRPGWMSIDSSIVRSSGQSPEARQQLLYLIQPKRVQPVQPFIQITFAWRNSLTQETGQTYIFTATSTTTHSCTSKTITRYMGLQLRCTNTS